ncbi:hypothetical protein EMIT053CA3_10299 [Pseudomonas donghuensis]
MLAVFCSIYNERSAKPFLPQRIAPVFEPRPRSLIRETAAEVATTDSLESSTCIRAFLRSPNG